MKREAHVGQRSEGARKGRRRAELDRSVLAEGRCRALMAASRAARGGRGGLDLLEFGEKAPARGEPDAGGERGVAGGAGDLVGHGAKACVARDVRPRGAGAAVNVSRAAIF